MKFCTICAVTAAGYAETPRMARLPRREPGRQFFEAAECPRRLCQPRFAAGGGGRGVEVRAGQMREERADFVEISNRLRQWRLQVTRLLPACVPGLRRESGGAPLRRVNERRRVAASAGFAAG